MGGLHPPSLVTFGIQTPQDPDMKSPCEEVREEKTETNIGFPDVWVSHVHLLATVQPAQLTPSRSEVSCPYFFAQIADLGAKSLAGCLGFKPLSWGIIC